MMGTEIVRIEQASCARGLYFQIRDIDLKLESGCVMGVIGRNGSGKTTLFHMLCGLSPVSSGRALICGKDLIQDPTACKQVTGTVFDDDYFRVGLSVKQAGQVYGRYYEEYSQPRFLESCKRFEIGAGKLVTKLSKGEYMKFQLAFALAHNPRLLLMDEPDAGLDPVFRREWKDILWDITGEDKSVLIASHLTEELAQFADYITFLRKGKQEFTLSMPEIEDSYKIVRGSRRQLELLREHLIGGIRHTEMYDEGLYRMSDSPIRLPVQIERPTLEEIMYYFDRHKEDKKRLNPGDMEGVKNLW